MSFGLYAGNSVQVVFGVLNLKDMRADEFVNVRYDEVAFEVVKGSDGSITRIATQNTLVHVDLIFKRSSNEHQKLSAIHIADRTTPNGAGVAPFLLKDDMGATLLAAEKAWLIGMPDSGNGKQVGGDVTWTIDMQVLPGQHIIGGNQLP